MEFKSVLKQTTKTAYIMFKVFLDSLYEEGQEILKEEEKNLKDNCNDILDADIIKIKPLTSQTGILKLTDPISEYIASIEVIKTIKAISLKISKNGKLNSPIENLLQFLNWIPTYFQNIQEKSQKTKIFAEYFVKDANQEEANFAIVSFIVSTMVSDTIKKSKHSNYNYTRLEQLFLDCFDSEGYFIEENEEVLIKEILPKIYFRSELGDIETIFKGIIEEQKYIKKRLKEEQEDSKEEIKEEKLKGLRKDDKIYNPYKVPNKRELKLKLRNILDKNENVIGIMNLDEFEELLKSLGYTDIPTFRRKMIDFSYFILGSIITDEMYLEVAKEIFYTKEDKYLEEKQKEIIEYLEKDFRNATVKTKINDILFDAFTYLTTPKQENSNVIKNVKKKS